MKRGSVFKKPVMKRKFANFVCERTAEDPAQSMSPESVVSV